MESVLVVAVVFLTCCSLIQSVAIGNGDDLLKEICAMNHSMNFTLNSSISYEITSQNTSCVVNGSYSLAIESKVGIANVTCINQNRTSPVPNIGIGFIGLENISISQVKFEGCGTQLMTLSGSYLNDSISSTRLFFLTNHSAFFVFINSSVKFNQVKISYYYGFAVIGINVVSANFTKLSVSRSLVNSKANISIGSGVLIIYTNSSPKSLLVHSSIFYANFDYRLHDESSGCVVPYRTVGIIHTAAALTVLSYDVSENILVTISNSSFNHNSGSHAGAVLVVLLNASSTDVVINQSSEFRSNINAINCPGSALAFYMMKGKPSEKVSSISPLKVVNTSFIKQDGMLVDTPIDLQHRKFGAVYAAVKHLYCNVTLYFSQLSFLTNYASHYASCLFVEVSQYFSFTNVILKGLTVCGNKQTSYYSSAKSGLFTFINVYKVHITGSNKFHGNFGSVFKSYSSDIYLDGESEFVANHALSGVAFNIENGHLCFGRALKSLLVQRNNATHLGGVIYAYVTSFFGSTLCSLQFEPINSTLNITAENNTAVNGGNVIFAFPAYNCHVKDMFVTSVNFYTRHLNITNSTNEISSSVHRIAVCRDVLSQLYRSPANHYPGETIKIPISAVDMVGNPAFSQIHVRLVKKPKMFFKPHQSKILSSEEFQNVKGNLPCSNCSMIDVTVHYLEKNDCPGYHHLYAFLYPIGDNSNVATPVPVPLNITECPLGFSLEIADGTCQCSEAVQRFYKSHSFTRHCDINHQTIPKPSLMVSPWFGSIAPSNKTGADVFALAYSCPSEFCELSLDHHSVHFDASASSFFLVTNLTTVSHKKPICRGNRKGTVCGDCTEEHSIVFGTSECKKCSNWWLWTIIFYVIAGPLLVYFLYLLKLTVTAGTLNGIIFFAQTANVGILETIIYFEGYSPQLSHFLIAFLSILNLNLGFPLCFYNGMNEFVKTGLSLVFPVYLLLFPTFFIVASRCSSRFSNRAKFLSVQVFVTVVHLSLSKLLLITIDVFTPTYVYTDKSDVPIVMWYRNANENFGFHNTNLVVLMVASAIISSVFLIPYFVLLVSGKCMIRSSFGNKYFRSAYESIHSPYRENRKYWFVARFFLLMLFHLIFAIFRSYGVLYIYLISFPLLMAFLICQVYLWPFKSKLVNIIDNIVVLVLVMLYMAVVYTMFDLHPVNIQRCMVVLTIFLFFIFILFMFVIFHHIMLVTSCYLRIIAAWKITGNSIMNQLKGSPTRRLLSSKNIDQSFCYESFREPVAGNL